MEVHFKKSVWERVSIPDRITKEELIALIDKHSPVELNHLLVDKEECLWENILETEELLTPDDNDSQTTIELLDDEGVTIYNNQKYM
ncbi:hypothetical protein HN682_00790 [Candidatus Peregrinibacteria bacterium]|jgi:hypothetical protein|nr:hypothetical protein [Candidatus Peregrinibacteria bacterium]